MDPETRELLRIVAADLDFLRDEWDASIEEDSIRRGSPVLRRFLVEGDLQKAWRAAGLLGQPHVEAVHMDAVLLGEPEKNFAFASTARARVQELEVSGYAMHRRALTADEVAERYRRSSAGPELRSTPLVEFTQATCLVIDGALISRRSVVKYVANRLGGAHLSSKSRRRAAADFRRLDRVHAELKVVEMPALYVEVLGMAQALSESKDLRDFSAHVAELLAGSNRTPRGSG